MPLAFSPSGDTDSLLSIIRRDFEGYIGIVAEEIAREAVRIANREDEFQVRFMRIGRYWDKAQEIDICDVSEDGSAFLWGECRWRRTKMSAEDEGVILWDAEKLDKLSGQTSRRQHEGISLKEYSLSRWLVLVCCSW